MKNKNNLILLFFAIFLFIAGCDSDVEGDSSWQYSVFNNSDQDAVLIGYKQQNPAEIAYKYIIMPGQFQEVFFVFSGEDYNYEDFLDVSRLEVYAGSDLKYTAYPDQDDPIFDDFRYTEVYRDDEQVISVFPLFNNYPAGNK